MKCIFKDFFLHPLYQEYRKQWIYLTIAYCDSSNSTNFHFMEFICWRRFKLSLVVLSCGNISYVKNVRFKLMLIQVVLSYRIVFSKCCQLKREALCLQVCFEMFAKTFGSIFNKAVCLQHPKKQINHFVVHHCKPKNVSIQKTWESM